MYTVNKCFVSDRACITYVASRLSFLNLFWLDSAAWPCGRDIVYHLSTWNLRRINAYRPDSEWRLVEVVAHFENFLLYIALNMHTSLSSAHHWSYLRAIPMSTYFNHMSLKRSFFYICNAHLFKYKYTVFLRFDATAMIRIVHS